MIRLPHVDKVGVTREHTPEATETFPFVLISSLIFTPALSLWFLSGRILPSFFSPVSVVAFSLGLSALLSMLMISSIITLAPSVWVAILLRTGMSKHLWIPSGYAPPPARGPWLIKLKSARCACSTPAVFNEDQGRIPITGIWEPDFFTAGDRKIGLTDTRYWKSAD